MKKYVFAITFIFIVSNVTGKKNPSTVVDYFLLLPDKYIGLGKLPASERLKMIKIKDIRNGWLKCSQMAWEGWLEMAIFRKPNKTYMTGIAVANCGPVCSQDIYFLEYRSKKWVDVTSNVFKKLSNSEIQKRYKKVFGSSYGEDEIPVLYEIPRHGTTLWVVTQEAFTGKKKKLAGYNFKNGKFILMK